MKKPKRRLVEDCEVLEADCPPAQLSKILAAQGSALSFDHTPCHYGGMRKWLSCPVCGRRVAKIYRPTEDSAFACRKCHDLTYRSVQNHDARLDRLIKADVLTLRNAVLSRNVKLALRGCRAAYIRWGLIEKY